MQREDFKNRHVLQHFDRVREATNNMMFMFAIRAKDLDRNLTFSSSLRASMGWPLHVENLYEYRMMYDGVYERLFQFCIISLCSDIEVFFKDTFDKYNYPRGSGNGFFQRLDDVIAKFESAGLDFAPINGYVGKMRLAFQVRHIGIHNMGVADEGFVSKTGVGSVGCVYLIDQTNYREMFDAYTAFLKHLDSILPTLPVRWAVC